MPWLVAFLFGLLHGIGFAGALQEIGLPQHAIPVALAFFNIGVDFDSCCSSLSYSVFWPASCLHQRPQHPRYLGCRRDYIGTAAYVVGTVAMFWVSNEPLDLYEQDQSVDWCRTRFNAKVLLEGRVKFQAPGTCRGQPLGENYGPAGRPESWPPAPQSSKASLSMESQPHSPASPKTRRHGTSVHR